MTETAEDRFLAGRVILEQPRHGYRAAMDPVLLAASVPAVRDGGRVLDLGCGVGAALFCYGWRVPEAALYGLEIDPAASATARRNAKANGMAARTVIETGDVLDPPAAFRPGSFDQVFANPPYMETEAGDASPIESRARSNVEGAAKLSDWIAAMLRFAKPKGGIALVHRADRLDRILTGLAGRAGEVTVIPLWPRAGVAAKRVIVRARKGVRGGAVMHPGLVLHGPGDTRYTAEAAAILRDGAPLE